jgi:ABC-2 type transport system ATP-binding protein
VNNPVIEITGLCKAYAGTAALNGLSLTVSRGEFFGLLGPNGAGKTTTVSILCGLIPFRRGKVLVEGKDVRTQMKDIKRTTGVVPQDIALYRELTVDENLRFFGNMHDIPRQTVNRRVDELVNDFGLAPHRKKRVEHLSGGMKRQVNLIAALLNRPSILFLDEPTAGVDVHSRSVIVEKLRQINRNGTTVIYTSHDMNEAETLCSRMAFLDGGKIILEGEPAALTKRFNAASMDELIRKLELKEIFGK